MFGEVADGSLGELLTRNWGQMIFATGLLLIYAAYYEEARLAMQVAGGDLIMVGLFV